jgi:hypothetical protein
LLVKLWGFALVGLGVVAASGFAAVGAHRLGSVRALSPARLAPVAPPRPLEPARVEVAATASGTFLGVEDELLVESLRRQPIQSVKFNKGGSSISLRITFADGSRAAFKPEQTNPQTVPRKEIAAYRLNRLLGLNNVPPAVARTVHRDDLLQHLVPESQPWAKRILDETLFDAEGFTRGEASFWIPVIVDSRLDQPEAIEQWTRWLTVGEAIPPEKQRLMAQLSTLLVFDLLDNNSDRFSGGNLMTSPDGQTLYYMDNTFGFQVEPQGHQTCRAFLQRCQKFSRRLVHALSEMDVHALRAAFDPEPVELSADEIGGVLARRDVALRYVDGLVARLGEGAVLVFP